MSPIDALRFAFTALRGHRLRTGLSLTGVAIGVAAVIILTSLGEGARRYVVGEFASLGSNLVIVIPGRTETTGAMPIIGGVPNDLTLDDAEALRRQVRGVRRIAPVVLGTVMARHGDRAREVTVAGTTDEMLGARNIELRVGRYLPRGRAEQSARVAVVGAKLQRELFADQSPLGQILRLGEERYRVIGVMSARGESLGVNMDEVVHIPVVQAMRMFDRTSLFRILVEVGSHDQLEAVKAATIRVLTERHDGEEDVTVLTQDAVISSFGRILTILTAALGGIAAVSLTVAGIGIMNVMLVSVSERTAEIGLLIAVGARRVQVLAVFLVEAAVLSSLGGAVGLAVGFGVAAAIGYLYPTFPVAAPLWAVQGASAISVTVGLVFGALPARRAARLDPVVALARR